MNLIEQIKVNDVSIDGYQGTFFDEIPEWLQVTIDSEDKVLTGVKCDGTTYIGGNLQVDGDIINLGFERQIDDAVSYMQEQVDEMLFDANETLSYFEPTDNKDLLQITTDIDGKILGSRTSDGTVVENIGIETKKINSENATFNTIEVNNVIALSEDAKEKLRDDLGIDTSTVRKLFPKPTYFDLLRDKCPKFYEHMKKKDKDVCIVLTGTSMTQGNRYTTERPDASERPPLLGTNDLASALYDACINAWLGQKYRRYDHADIIYSESIWQTTNDLVVNDVHIWDDRAQFKNPWTKTTVDANAYVSFIIPDDAWQFNFIYKTDTTGGTCTVTITEGNSKVEVWNSSSWVEANGYSFSMHEDEAQYTPQSGLNTRGNTTYLKRLKMRCKNNTTGGINSIGETKVITISKGNDSTRLNVVGFEWSPREFMFTFINGARGSQLWGMEYTVGYDLPDLDLTNLEAWQDNDIWAFEPDLIISEVTCINWGASNEWTSSYRKRQFEYYARKAFFNEAINIAADGTETPVNDQRSLYVKSNGYVNCEIMFFGSLLMGADNAMYDENGNFIFVSNAINGNLSRVKNNIAGDSYGTVKLAMENYDWVDWYMKSKTDYIYIPTLWEFVRIAFAYYGSYKAAFAATGANGNSLSFDETHLNDNGAALWAAMIAPIFEF